VTSTPVAKFNVRVDHCIMYHATFYPDRYMLSLIWNKKTARNVVFIKFSSLGLLYPPPSPIRAKYGVIVFTHDLLYHTKFYCTICQY